MKRKKRILITAYHEIGHYLMIKKFFNDFSINGVVKEIELCPKEFGRKGGRVRFSTNVDFDYEFDYANTSIEMLYGWLSIAIAGFVATKLACNFSPSDLVQYTDYIRAHYYASILSKKLKKTPEKILKECEKEVKLYLANKRYLLDELSGILFKQRFLNRDTLETLANKYSL